MNHFWTYTVWYVLLGVITLGEIAAALVLAGDRRLVIGLYLILAGIVLSFETVILIFLDAYAYYPMLLQTSPVSFDRILAGNLFSQTSVAATALLVAVFGLRFRWQAALAGLYGLVEEAFLALGIYAHNWYMTWMTVVGLLVYFQLARQLFAALRRGIGPHIFYGCVAAGLFPLYIVTIVWGFMVPGHLDFGAGLFGDPVKSRYFLCLALYAVPASAVMMLVRYAGWPWPAKAVLVSALWLFFHVNGQFGFIIFRQGWFWIITAVTNAWLYASVALMDRLLAGAANRR